MEYLYFVQIDINLGKSLAYQHRIFVPSGTVTNNFPVKQINEHTDVIPAVSYPYIGQITDYNVILRLGRKFSVYYVLHFGFIAFINMRLILCHRIGRNKPFLFHDPPNAPVGYYEVLFEKLHLDFSGTIIIPALPEYLPDFNSQIGICFYHIYFRPKISAACFKMSFSTPIVYCVYAVPLVPASLWNGYLSRGKNQRQQTAHDSNSFSTFYFTCLKISVQLIVAYPVVVSGQGSTVNSTINVKIVDLDKNPPPNPVADDRNDSFYHSYVPNREEKTTANWSIWRPWWQEYWVWHSTGEDSGYWCNHGWWEFDLEQYTARLSSDMKITNDSKNPTANGNAFKSGYGINQIVTGNMSTNQSSAVTYPQNAVSYFPEFQYETYWRLLERVLSGSNARFEFKKNNYSTYKNRTHFTPIWMPNGTYTVNTWLIDAWTPVGMLSINLTDSLEIRGNLWQDWHIAPLKP